MFLTTDLAGLEQAGSVRRSMFRDRASQFVDRHKWPLRLDSAGFEVDEFDDPATTYCIVAEDGRHNASLRVRPGAAGTMAEAHFPELWRAAQDELAGCPEVSRFCAAPVLTVEERIAAVSDLLLGLCRHCQRQGTGAIFGVVFPTVARVIRQAGWPGEILSTAKHGDDMLLLVRWVPSEMVAWAIQERREQQEEVWTRRRDVARPMPMVA